MRLRGSSYLPNTQNPVFIPLLPARFFAYLAQTHREPRPERLTSLALGRKQPVRLALGGWDRPNPVRASDTARAADLGGSPRKRRRIPRPLPAHGRNRLRSASLIQGSALRSDRAECPRGRASMALNCRPRLSRCSSGSPGCKPALNPNIFGLRTQVRPLQSPRHD